MSSGKRRVAKVRYLRSGLVILGLIVAFTIFISYLVSRSPQYDLTEDHASFRTNEWGTRALREICERNQLEVKLYERPWAEFDARPPAVLCILDPNFGPEQKQLTALIDWVRRGGHIVLAVDTDRVLEYNATYGYISANHVLLAYLRLLSLPVGSYRTTVAVKPAVPSPVASEVTQLRVNSPQRLVVASSTDEVQQHLRQLVGDRQQLPTIEPIAVHSYQPLLADNDGVLVMRVRIGQGMIDVISDADILGNGQIGQADNIVLAMNLIYARGAPAAVYFDEYHHGRRLRPVAQEELPGTFLIQALLALLACLVIYVILGGLWRFGRPVPLKPEARRSLAEHIAAFAGLYQGAQATSAALTKIAQQFQRRLTQITGLPPSADPQELARAVGQSFAVDSDRLAALLRELAAIDTDAELSEARMLDLTRKIATFEEVIRDAALHWRHT